ncbi:hypothetical protein BJ508DRAFT_333655 [Ascobolus immersus RN42]|uniref:Uncharacterized protein n=1 Tax=Ascobolus immersus RN42 TaxID=1160509 RepID=A0A3N4HLV6_ASCIM|nr:hypothetical protein BJ508DRAFT_333655 [Ascobolus immersus RN42]
MAVCNDCRQTCERCDKQLQPHERSPDNGHSQVYFLQPYPNPSSANSACHEPNEPANNHHGQKYMLVPAPPTQVQHDSDKALRPKISQSLWPLPKIRMTKAPKIPRNDTASSKSSKSSTMSFIRAELERTADRIPRGFGLRSQKSTATLKVPSQDEAPRGLGIRLQKSTSSLRPDPQMVPRSPGNLLRAQKSNPDFRAPYEARRSILLRSKNSHPRLNAPLPQSPQPSLPASPRPTHRQLNNSPSLQSLNASATPTTTETNSYYFRLVAHPNPICIDGRSHTYVGEDPACAVCGWNWEVRQAPEVKRDEKRSVDAWVANGPSKCKFNPTPPHFNHDYAPNSSVCLRCGEDWESVSVSSRERKSWES